MSNVTFPIWAGQPGVVVNTMTITGASVSSSAASTAGLDLRGKFLATAVKSSNVVTIQFPRPGKDVPIIIPIPLTANAAVDLSAITATGFVYTSVTRDAHGTPINDIDISFLIITYESNQVFQ